MRKRRILFEALILLISFFLSMSLVFSEESKKMNKRTEVKVDNKERPDSMDKPVSSPQATTDSQMESVESYWTEERMRNATPMPMPKVSGPQPESEIPCDPCDKTKGRETKMTDVDKEQLRTAERVLANNKAQLIRLPGVLSVGLGLTEKGDQAAILLYVDLKSTAGTVPSAIPKQIHNVPVRVIETGESKTR